MSVKKRFLRLDVKITFSEVCKNTSDMVMVYVLRFRVDKDVIDHHEDIRHILEDVIHEMLECCGCIGKTHWHDEELKESIMSPKHCFPLMT